MVSESIARALWPGENAMDKTVRGGRAGAFVVVGVVKDTGVAAFTRRDAGEVYVALADRSVPRATLVVHSTADPRAFLNAAIVAASGSGRVQSSQAPDGN